MGFNFSLNPFVQVFYSNWILLDSYGYGTCGLNPFVQVFYSNGLYIRT